MPTLTIPHQISQRLLDALNALNWSYGKGDIIGFEKVNESGHDGTVVCKLQFGQQRARFTVKNGTVYFRGHQKKL